MNRGKLIVSLASAGLVLALAMAGCGTTPGGGGTVTEDRQYNALNPRGIQPAIEITALAPRLATLDGMIIYVDQGEADPIIMPVLYDRLVGAYPDTEFRRIATSGFGPASPEQEVLDEADAVIRGIAW